MTSYRDFLQRRAQEGCAHGFEPLDVPQWLFPFQKALVEWSVRQGRGAIFADCGLGKTNMALAWAKNVYLHTGRRVLIAAPLAVSQQIASEATEFGFDAERRSDGTLGNAAIVVTNYERLHLFRPQDFGGMVCDESSILKNFDGQRKALVTEFLRTMPYRLLATATAAPNDYVELGTSSEALGEMGHTDMLGRFFRNDQNSIKSVRAWGGDGWRFKHHAEGAFWRWVCSWARACRKPQDVGFDDARFVLPKLMERQHEIKASQRRPGFLFDLPAEGLKEQREEAARTVTERCEKVAELCSGHDMSLVWCNRNEEGDLLERLIPGAVQVAGRHTDDEKEERLTAFARGEIKVLVTKPKIGAMGLNLQSCAHVTFFPTHSYEQYYQGIRRCWRFGQKRPVTVDIVATEGEVAVMESLRRKAIAADRMFTALVEQMNNAQRIERSVSNFTTETKVPSWL